MTIEARSETHVANTENEINQDAVNDQLFTANLRPRGGTASPEQTYSIDYDAAHGPSQKPACRFTQSFLEIDILGLVPEPGRVQPRV